MIVSLAAVSGVQSFMELSWSRSDNTSFSMKILLPLGTLSFPISHMSSTALKVPFTTLSNLFCWSTSEPCGCSMWKCLPLSPDIHRPRYIEVGVFVLLCDLVEYDHGLPDCDTCSVGWSCPRTCTLEISAHHGDILWEAHPRVLLDPELLTNFRPVWWTVWPAVPSWVPFLSGWNFRTVDLQQIKFTLLSIRLKTFG